MEPHREVEDLRAQLQVNHIGFVIAEIRLIATLLEMSRTEYDLGFIEAGAKSLRHAREAIAAAGKGLDQIDSLSQREVFEQRLQELVTAARDFRFP